MHLNDGKASGAGAGLVSGRPAAPFGLFMNVFSATRRPCSHTAPSAQAPVKAARSSDRSRAALDVLFRSERAWLLAFLRRRVGHEDAEDLLQEVFLRAATSRHLGELRNPGGFLCRIAQTVIADRARRTRCRIWTVPIEVDGHTCCDGEQEARLLAEAAEIEFETALNELPEKTRKVFRLNRSVRLTYREIQDELGLSCGGVEYHMMKALAHLRSALASD
nr:sigma-70 family RNA polymerase sigma factor [Qipengyuania qiaonensis]